MTNEDEKNLARLKKIAQAAVDANDGVHEGAAADLLCLGIASSVACGVPAEDVATAASILRRACALGTHPAVADFVPADEGYSER
jgi:hypothetical protein